MTETEKKPKIRPDQVFSYKWSQPKVYQDEFSKNRVRPKVDCLSVSPGRADQSQAKDCDVNHIIKQYKVTGVLKGSGREGLYADFSQAPDLATAHEIINKANEQFSALNAFTRLKFDNDPAKFLAFVNDPKNGEELIKMGLATKAPKTDTDRVIEAIRSSNKPLKPEGDSGSSKKSQKGKEE